MTTSKKCRDCKWLTGEKSSVGIECMQEDNQKRWNAKEKRLIEANVFYPYVVARYKSPSARACKHFEE